jgi:LuxR family maltose regulon positive regulatory protein
MNRALALVDAAPELASDALPLLETKRFVPRARSSLVARPRLTSVLRQRPAQRLTLISAPAGFGKTTLLAEWRSELSLP